MDYIRNCNFRKSTDFGDCTSGMGIERCCNATRGVWAGFHTPSVTNIIEFHHEWQQQETHRFW